MKNGSKIEKEVAMIDAHIKAFNPISLGELMKKEFADTSWIIESLVPSEGIVIISGAPATYKTWLVLYLTITIAKGDILFGQFTTTKTGILIIDEETGERWLQPRIKMLQREYNLPIFLLSKTGFKLREETINEIIDFSNLHGIKVVILDSLLRVHTSSDENNAVEMAKVFGLVQKLNKAGLTVIFTHHSRKQGQFRSSNPAQDIRGSSDILAAIDCHLAIERDDEFIIVTQTKLRQAEELKPFKLAVIKEGNELRFEYLGEVDDAQTKKHEFKEYIKQILDTSTNAINKTALFKQCKVAGAQGGHTTFKNTYNEMLNNNDIFETKGSRNTVLCSIVPFESKNTSIDINNTQDSQNSPL